MHKKVTRVYRIKGVYRKISEKDLRDLRNTIDKILGDGSVDLGSYSGKSMVQLVKEEEQRHRKALRDIYDNF